VKPDWYDHDKHPPGYTAIATIAGGTIATLNGTGYLLDDDGTRTALAKLPKARLVELVVSQARTVSKLRDGLMKVRAICPERNEEDG